MAELLPILPLAALIIFAVILIRAGRGRKPHDRGNITGGGPGVDETRGAPRKMRGHGFDNDAGSDGDGGGGD